jgi:hypothetical protein
MNDIPSLELPSNNSIYPGCLVVLLEKSRGDYFYGDRVIMLDKNPRDVRASDVTRRLPVEKGAVGVAIEIFPNALVRKSERTWLIYFHPKMAVVEQSRLQRVSFSWKETRK